MNSPLTQRHRDSGRSGLRWCARFGAILLVGTLGLIGPVPGASASPPPPLVSLAATGPTGPFSTGEVVEVTAPANSVLKPKHELFIEECAASFGRTKAHRDQCDHRTVQPDLIRTAADGSFTYADYVLYALPDKLTLHETKLHRPICDLSHACVLVVGYDFDDPSHRIWSAPFLVSPTGGTIGPGPGSGTPEVPYALALPALVVAIIGGTLLVRRRRSAAVSPH